MFSAKDAQTIARAAQRRGSLAYRQNRRRTNGGQSLVVAIIVLFILLFLGGVFIALIANNLRNTRRGVQVSAANKFAEAGIKYLDQQLMTSPEGADWRPIPRCLPTDDCTNNLAPKYLNPEDPDYFWLKPYNPATREGGFARVVFGGPTASQSNLGGRALVRVSYNPYRTAVDTNGNTVYWEDRDNSGTFDPAEIVTPEIADRTRRYVQLESIGRVGVLDELDPTTFGNSEGKNLRRELVAYKALGLTESLRFITDKDKRRVSATLGAPYRVGDRDAIRPIYNVFQGAVRSNTDLTFYGLNYLSLDPRRGDALEVAGTISLNASATDPTKVYVTDGQAIRAPLIPVAPVIPVVNLSNGTQPGNLIPSASTAFSTLNGLIRDNPRGNETQDLPADAGNNNLRAVPRLDPPLMDAATGDGGLTRYRALTRDSARMPVAQTGTDPGNVDGQTNVAVGINGDYAGAYGWGQNLYIPNAVDLQQTPETASNVSSLRAEWLNPSQATGAASNWKTDGNYAPPAVTITLTPRYMALTQSRIATGRSRSYLRNPSNGRPIPQETMYRYTYEQGGALATAPTLGIDDGDGNRNTVPDGPGPSPDNNTAKIKFAGYPATRAGQDGIPNTADDTPYYDGDFVIFAEGNVRIKGSVGGFDPESGQTFVRRLTVVTNGTVYFDGNLLRDNISPELAAASAVNAQAKGKSTIAVLAKNYAAVNTTQFLTASLSSDVTAVEGAVPGESQGTRIIRLSGDTLGPKVEQRFDLTLGPILTYDANGLPRTSNVYNAAADDINQTPPYLGVANSLSLLLRHAPETGTPAAVNLFVNSYLEGTQIVKNRFEGWRNATGATYPLILPAGTPYTSNEYFLNPLPPDPSATFLFPVNGFPFVPNQTGTTGNLPTIGLTNDLLLQYDSSSGGAGAGAYRLSRAGVVPLDVRIEALIYAQEGSFFIIPGPWFNPNPSDTYANYVKPDPVSLIPRNRRDGENPTADPNALPAVVNPAFPFYGEPLDIRITMFGAITENLPAEIGDQGAWLQKWGWVPRFYGSTGLAGLPTQGNSRQTFHGSVNSAGGVNDGVGNGITYVYDPRLSSPYDAIGTPLRTNPNFIGLPGTLSEPLPPMPRLPVAPGLLYYGERPIQ